MNVPRIRLLALCICLSGSVYAATPDANAQGFIKRSTEELPKVQFYMARQQWQVIDDSPIINHQQGAAPGQQPLQQGAMQNRPAPLPRAGFQQYSPQVPSFSGGLPQVVNGVPPKDIPGSAHPKGGKKAHAGKLGPGGAGAGNTNKAAAKPPSPPISAAKAYSPYKGYNPQTPVATSTGAGSNNNNQSRTNVKGSVLHWARGGR